MWGRKRSEGEAASAEAPGRLKQALRQARIESAERSSVVVDLRDAELARLELLNEALDPLFAEIPDEVELFDRGISRGDTPRLWIDAVCHVVMGRDKRHYRLVQDTRYGRKMLAETSNVDEMADAVTRYVASRLIERERTLGEYSPLMEGRRPDIRAILRSRRWRLWRAFVLGLIVGALALSAALWLASRAPLS